MTFRASSLSAGAGGVPVAGPASSTDRGIPTWNGTSGNLLRNNTGATIDANGVAGLSGVNVTGGTAPTNGIALFNTNVLGFYTGGSVRATVNASGQIVMSGGAGAALTPTASGTAPSLIPRASDGTTGIGSQASGNFSGIAGGVEITRTTANGVITIQQTTVSGLPAAATAGAGTRRFVTDALGPVFGAAVTGGGAVFSPVYSDGAIWRCG